MSTPTTKLTVGHPTATQPAASTTAGPVEINLAAPQQRIAPAQLGRMANMRMQLKKQGWTSGSFRPSTRAAGGREAASTSIVDATAATALPTGYSQPPGVAGPLMPPPTQMPRPPIRQPRMPMPPDQQMRPPMLNDGQSPMHHFWQSLIKMGESMAQVIHAIARSISNVH